MGYKTTRWCDKCKQTPNNNNINEVAFREGSSTGGRVLGKELELCWPCEKEMLKQKNINPWYKLN